MKRILHVGLGPLGQRILTDMHDRSLCHLVAAVDVAPALAGRSVATIVPGADPRVHVCPSLDAVDCWDNIDCAIVTTSSDLPSCADTFRELLRRGKPIVSTCEELVYPWLRHVGLSEELDELAKRHGGRLLGTGVNPGFLMDALPAALTAVCKSVRGVSCYRIQDASSRRIPFQKKIGVGLEDAQFNAKVKDGSLRHVGLGESLHFIAHFVGLKIERWEEDIAPVRADRDMTSGMGLIPKGRICGVRQMARGYHDERTVVNLEFQAAIGQADPHDRVVIDGEPPIDMIIRGGVHGDIATSAIVLNAIRAIMNAPPGLHTMASVVPVTHA
ncbi:MAG: dihydrodipicolinate reductase [Planctomycetota bacterium]|nr:dihydrodipicolinate reductase [Planctomycetota bacterium]